MSGTGGQRKRRNTRRRRIQRSAGGGRDVYVLYESGEHIPKSPKLLYVFGSRDAAVKKVEELIKPLNAEIMDGEFIMKKYADAAAAAAAAVAGVEEVAFSESRKGGFYVETVPFEEG